MASSKKLPHVAASGEVKNFPSEPFRVVRPEDGLDLYILLDGFDLDAKTARPRLRTRQDDATVTLIFPRQGLAEEGVVYDPRHPEQKPRASASQFAFARPSRLTFRVPKKGLELPCELEAVLGLCSEDQLLCLLRNALPPSYKEATQDALRDSLYTHGAKASIIEIPHRIVLAPVVDDPKAPPSASFRVPAQRQQKNDRDVLWHARLSGGGPSIVLHRRGEDWLDPTNETAPLPATTRTSIVDQAIREAYKPKSLRVLALTSVGGWLDLDCWFPTSTDNSLLRWVHRSARGRDQSVRVVVKGFLYPIGIKAIYTRQVERRVIADESGRDVAVPERRGYIELLESQRTFAVDRDTRGVNKDSLVGAGRRFGLQSVDLGASVRTPALDPESADIIVGAVGDQKIARWIRVRGEDVVFPACLDDHEGDAGVTAGMRFIFVSESAAAGHLDEVQRAYEGPIGVRARNVPIHGQKLALVPPQSKRDTSSARVPIRSLELRAIAVACPDGVPFHPVLESAVVRLPDVEQLVARSQQVEVDIAGLKAELGRAAERPLAELRHLASVVKGYREALSEARSRLNDCDASLLPRIDRAMGLASAAASLLDAAAQWSIGRDPLGTLVATVRTSTDSVVASLAPAVAQLARDLSDKAIEKKLPQTVAAIVGAARVIPDARGALHGALADLLNIDASGAIVALEPIRTRIAAAASVPCDVARRSIALAQTQLADALEAARTATSRIAGDILGNPDVVKLLTDAERSAVDEARASIDQLRVKLDTETQSARATLASAKTDAENTYAAVTRAAANRYDFAILPMLDMVKNTMSAIQSGLDDVEGAVGTASQTYARDIIDRLSSLVGRPDLSADAAASLLARLTSVREAVARSASGVTSIAAGALDQLDVLAGQSGTALVLSHLPTYVTEGLLADDVNPQRVWAQFRDALPIRFNPEQVAGVALPDLRIQGLSRIIGPISAAGALDALMKKKINPRDFFPNMRVFGAISLLDLIGDLAVDTLPGLRTEPLPGPKLRASFDWETTDLSPKGSLFVPNANAKLSLHAHMVFDAGDHPGRVDDRLAKVRLENFALEFFHLLRVDFGWIEVSSGTDGGTHVDPHVTGFALLGELDFFSKLLESLPGLGNPPILGLSNGAIQAGLRFAIPTVATGAFTMRNLVFESSLSLSLSGKPATVTLSLAEPDNPFSVIVSLLGGGGFFAMDLATEGDFLQGLKIGIEFGGMLAFDVCVAHGVIYAMGGIRVSHTPSRTILTAYFRIGGNVDVLGLISASIESIVSLAYDGKVLTGCAMVTVDIHILFFSESVTFSVQKTIGKPGRSKRRALEARSAPIDIGQVQAYVEAFA